MWAAKCVPALPAGSVGLRHSHLQTILRICGRITHGQDEVAVRKLGEDARRVYTCEAMAIVQSLTRSREAGNASKGRGTRPRQVRYLDWDDSLVREVVRSSHMSEKSPAMRTGAARIRTEKSARL